MDKRVIGIGHKGPPREVVCPPWLRGAEAQIFQCKRPVTTTGKPRAGEWVLRFERRTPPFVGPLMGWPGGEDTFATQVELTFSSLDEAVGYAERQELSYHVSSGTASRGQSRTMRVEERHEPGESKREELNGIGAVIWLDAVRLACGRCDLSMLPDLEQALVSPAAVFDRPDDVLRHPLLTHNCKREILWRWAWDEYLIEIAQDQGMPGVSSSRLDEVRTALIQLGDEWHPHPAAPAAFPLRLEQPEPSLAAWGADNACA